MHAIKMALAANKKDEESLPKKVQSHNILIDFSDPEFGNDSIEESPDAQGNLFHRLKENSGSEKQNFSSCIEEEKKDCHIQYQGRKERALSADDNSLSEESSA